MDVDLALEDNASRVSRQQARLVLRAPGRHTLTNTGRRALTVNNRRARPSVPDCTLFYVSGLCCALGGSGCQVVNAWHAGIEGGQISAYWRRHNPRERGSRPRMISTADRQWPDLNMLSGT